MIEVMSRGKSQARLLAFQGIILTREGTVIHRALEN
jgi:hypothetical protein